MVFESLLSRRNCQTFSTGLTPGLTSGGAGRGGAVHLGGSGSSAMLAGTASAAEVCHQA